MQKDKVLALDTETFYSESVSVTKQGMLGYIQHPEFDCYMVSVVGSDGYTWCGHPKDAPWGKFGEYRTWLSHNQGFDGPVVHHLCEKGLFNPSILPEQWHCTADLMAFLGYPRSLEKACLVLYKEKLDKDVRNVVMKNTRWESLDEATRKRVLDYALVDAVQCLRLWTDYGHEWPETERQISAHSYKMGLRGIPIDLDGIHKDIELLGHVLFHNAARIPWVANGEKPLSPKALAATCRAVGIDPPASLAQDSDECSQWELAYGSTYPWVAAMRSWRRANGIRKKYETMRDRAIDHGTHWRLPYSLKYFGASTGRWSGSGGFNPQNMSRDPLYIDKDWFVVDPDDSVIFDRAALTAWKADKKTVYMRGRIKASPGKKLIISDLSQIEPRVTAYLSGNRKFLDLVRKGFGPYEAHARKAMGWTGGVLKKESPQFYALAKARLLALNFAAGWFKFIDMAKLYVGPEVFRQIFEKAPTPAQVDDFLAYLKAVGYDRETGKIKNVTYAGYFNKFPKLPEKTQWVWTQSWLQVTDFRENEPELRNLWNRLRDELSSSVGGNYFITLPSGREVRYFNVSMADDQIRVQTTKGEHASRAHHGILIENITQACARDVFGEAILRIERELSVPVILHIHDEVIVEADDTFDETLITAAMTTSPDWCRSLPIGAETESSLTYKK